MTTALIVSASRAGAAKIAEWLGEGVSCTVVDTHALACRILQGEAFDLLIINAPLLDGDGLALPAHTAGGTLVLAPQAQYEAVCAQMEPLGVLTLPRPVSPLLFRQAIALLRATYARIGRLQDKLDEVRLVDRAKWTLIRTLHMDEAQAHRYIEKQAMDMRQTRREVAQRIIQTYEN